MFGTTTKTAQQKLPRKLQQKRERVRVPPTRRRRRRAAEEAGTSTRRNEKERADAVEAAAWVVDALVEAATRRSTKHGGCVSSDKSTDDHAALDVPE